MATRRRPANRNARTWAPWPNACAPSPNARARHWLHSTPDCSPANLSDRVATRVAAARKRAGRPRDPQLLPGQGRRRRAEPDSGRRSARRRIARRRAGLHLAKVYGQPLTRAEAGTLIATICAQLAALMGAIWGVHLVSARSKASAPDVSTVVTAGAQGALAWYATEIVGRAAEHYLLHGKSWGDQGAKTCGRRYRRQPGSGFDFARSAGRDLWRD